MSSEYGWVPEYAQWQPDSDKHCETCCIKDMIECALELNKCGYDYWDVVDKFTRNHLSEQQIKDGCFVSVDNGKTDKDGITWHDMDKRVVGGWSGGGEANSLSMTKFRSIAGCCIGTAPQALFYVWEKIIEKQFDGIYINIPMEKENDVAKVTIGYPNDGFIKITSNCSSDFHIRTYYWMGSKIEIRVNDKVVPVTYSKGLVFVEGVNAGDIIILSHELQTVKKIESLQGREFTVLWKGSDVVKIEPEGDHLRLYQRELGVEKV